MASRIFYEAFERKLFPILRNPEKVRSLLSECFAPQFIYTAHMDSNLVGMIGLEYAGEKFYQVKMDAAIRHLGFVYGILAWIVLALFMEGSHRPNEIRIAALAVAADCRGMGIGTKLIEDVIHLAKEMGYQAVRLEVVDTNQRAYQLYRRMGFEPVRTIRFGLLTQRLGFSAEIEMIHRI